MKYPKKLSRGGTVGLVCTSSAISTERIEVCKRTVEDMGYRVKAAGNLNSDYGGYMAGTGEERAYWINKMFADRDVDAVFCVRGGNGSSRIMEFLDLEIIRKNPKIFVGYSDVTNLHLAINQIAGVVTFHGPMVSSNMAEDFDPETRESFFNAINAEGEIVFKNSNGFDIGIMRRGRGRGILTGGNLSLLSASIGTSYEVDTERKILFIEEVCEPISKIEKWAYHLRNAGKFGGCEGILLGQFTEVANLQNPEFDAVRCFEDALAGLDVPVMYNIQSGHGRPMMTLPMGAVCTMDTDSKRIIFKKGGN